jgi:hypothetical protein
MNTSEIENLLRTPPAPKPPHELRERLLAGVDLPERNAVRVLSRPASGSWLRRWWPTLLPAAVALGAASVLTLEGVKIRSIQDTIAALSHGAATAESPAATTVSESSGTSPSVDEAARYEEEMARLKAAVAEARAQVAQLEQLRVANEKLKTRLAALPDRLSAEETDAMDQAHERAMSIACVNNLKQFGLAVRVWGADNANACPPDILSMSNEVGSAKILVCPADKSHKPAESMFTFTPANCSYEYLTPSLTNADAEPNRVLSRCPIHGHIGLCDGSVQAGVGKNHPEWLVERDGKLYFEPKYDSAQPATAPGQSNP